MKFNSRFHAIAAACFTFATGALLVSCGGGGGGGSSGGGGGAPTPIDASSMAAAIPEFSAVLPVCKATASSSAASSTTASLVSRFKLARAALGSQGSTSLLVGVLTSTPPPDAFGDCGGRMTYLSYSHVSGVTTATLSYENYCTTDTSTGEHQTMNGQIPFVNTATPTSSGPITTRLEAGSPSGVRLIKTSAAGTQLSSQTMAFSGFAYNVGVPGGDPTAANPDRMTLTSATLTDNVTGKSYREENYAISSFTTAGGGEQMTLSGRGYRSSGDYFDVATSAPIITSASGATVSGEITVAGAAGSSAVLTLVPGAVMQATLKVNGTAYTSVPACR